MRTANNLDLANECSEYQVLVHFDLNLTFHSWKILLAIFFEEKLEFKEEEELKIKNIYP